MFVRSLILAAGIVTAFPAFACENLSVVDSYARVSGPNAKSGAAFVVIENKGTSEDRLIGATTSAANKVEIHTHTEDADGVMRMIHVEDGLVLPAGGKTAMQRGGDHLMIMGLNTSLADGDTVSIRLEFEHAAPMNIDVPVDLNRKPES